MQQQNRKSGRSVDWWEGYYGSNDTESTVIIIFFWILNGWAFVVLLMTLRKYCTLRKAQKPLVIVT